MKYKISVKKSNMLQTKLVAWSLYRYNYILFRIGGAFQMDHFT